MKPWSRSTLATLLAATLTGAAWPGAARAETPAESHPLHVDIGVFTGFSAQGDPSGLGNALNPDDVPGSGALVGLHAGVVLLDGRLGIEAALRNVFTDLRSGRSNASVNVLAYRLQGLWYFGPQDGVRVFGLLGLGQERFTHDQKQCSKTGTSTDCLFVKSPDTDDAFQVGLGVRIPITYRMSIRALAAYVGADGRPAAAGKPNSGESITHNFEGQIGAQFTLGGRPADGDKDGVPDEQDKCPNVAEDKDGWEDKDGCIDPDDDGDGVDDAADKCPRQAEDFDKFEDGDGCPDPDNDGDGVLDAADKCPTKPETKNGWQDEDGCPDEADSDGDGIANDKDKCLNQKEDRDGFQDDDGCPDPDNDGDGIDDAKDKCRDQPETKNGIDDTDGCPDKLGEAVAKLFEGPVTALEFKADKLQKSADPHLEPLVELLLEQEAVRVDVSVQPDDATEPAKKVAEARAAAIKAWLVDHGIDAARITASASAAPATPVKPGKGAAKPAVTFKIL